jgi:NADH dehydrogenase FAD-containing subunit
MIRLRAVEAHPARGGTLIVGGGFAGGYVAHLLGKHGATIVSPENFMLYTPILPEAASGTLEPRRVEDRANVWALGDCARVSNEATPDHPDPPTRQHALRQARRLAKNLHGEPRPYRYRMLGQVATLGRHKGIADVLGVRLRGFPGWFTTRTYHLFQLPLVSRKLRVVVDWTVALFFRRDIAELSMLGRPQPLRDE